MVDVPSFMEARSRIIPLLNSETWEYWWYEDKSPVNCFSRFKNPVKFNEMGNPINEIDVQLRSATPEC